MTRDILMPKWGLTMEEGTIVSWEIEVGDRIEVGDVIGVVETEKVEVDLESPVAGTVVRILVEEDETVDVGTVLVLVE
ncbi:MAG: DUF2118 domain-containing protein [bacterium]|nr:DUF2118 domain-containing protein [Acidimicrobiia bacterium]MCY4650632.1 DUF2118 domain-containing protein [bacterium]